MPKRLGFVLLLLGAALLTLAIACGEEEEEAATVTEEEETVTEEVAGPSIEFTSLYGGVTVPAGDLPMEVAVSNFNVVDKAVGISAACPDAATCPNTAGEGHIHFYLLGPDESVPTTPGQPAITPGETYHAGVTTSYTWPNVQPGTYKVAVQLVNNNHTPLEPPVVSEIEVVVQ